MAIALKRSLLIFQLCFFFLRTTVHHKGQPIDFGALSVPKSLRIVPTQCENAVIHAEREDFSSDFPSAKQLGKQSVAAIWPQTQHPIGLQVF